MLTNLKISGYKSFRDETNIPFSKITVMAGQNSSGKSSSFQMLLLMKQTTESSFNPPLFNFNGDLIKFTESKQYFSNGKKSDKYDGKIRLGFTWDKSFVPTTHFSLPLLDAKLRTALKELKDQHDISISCVIDKTGSNSFGSTEFCAHVYGKEFKFNPQNYDLANAKKLLEQVLNWTNEISSGKSPELLRNYEKILTDSIKNIGPFCFPNLLLIRNYKFPSELFYQLQYNLESWCKQIIYLPGIRKQNSRNIEIQNAPLSVSKQIASKGFVYPGRFDVYLAAILSNSFGSKSNPISLERIAENLEKLQLASSIEAIKKDDVNVEINVSRGMSKSSKFVSMADVGIGVSQVLPILVALEVANKNSTLIIEQPELHLHPAAQLALASILVEKSKSVGQIIIETHSEHLILGLQAEVAKHKLAPTDLAINWFERNKDGWSSLKPLKIEDSGIIYNSPIDYDIYREKALDGILQAQWKQSAMDEN